jgi:hypothetical protein
MLGHSGGKPSVSFPAGTGEILLDNVQCKGDEKNIKECKANDIGSHNCRHDEDIGIICEGKFILNTHSSMYILCLQGITAERRQGTPCIVIFRELVHAIRYFYT